MNVAAPTETADSQGPPKMKCSMDQTKGGRDCVEDDDDEDGGSQSEDQTLAVNIMEVALTLVKG